MFLCLCSSTEAAVCLFIRPVADSRMQCEGRPDKGLYSDFKINGSMATVIISIVAVGCYRVANLLGTDDFVMVVHTCMFILGYCWSYLQNVLTVT